MRFGKQNARPGGYEGNSDLKTTKEKGANMAWEIMLRLKKYRIREGSIAEWLLIIATGFTFWSILALVAIAVYA